MRNVVRSVCSMWLLLILLSTPLPTSGIPSLQNYIPCAFLPNGSSFFPAGITKARSILMSVSFSASVASQVLQLKPLSVPTVAPAPSPLYLGPVASPSSSHLPETNDQQKRHQIKPTVSPPLEPDCTQICTEPYTSAPVYTPCGCVIPIKIGLLLGVSLYTVFPLGTQLQMDIAQGTYLKQRQVVITGATADSENQDKALVAINLLPLREKFDETTATLICQRLWLKKVPINKTSFGNYKVVYINYPGINTPPPTGGPTGNGSSGSAGTQQIPITADVVDKHQKMSPKIVFIIVFSGLVLSMLCCLVLFVLIRSMKNGSTPNANSPLFTQSINKKRATGSVLSSSLESSTPLSAISDMPPSVLSVRTFTLAELGKATHGFSSEMVLGEGGFGRVYLGVLEDDTEVAVKLLTRDKQNGGREFVAEVEMLSRLHHRNLVKLVGICVENHIRCLVYDLVPNGSVESHLHGVDKEKGTLDWDMRLKIALGAARGLAYLHEDSTPRVIHRDFKASNVLLEDDFTPRVSDFGLAREATEGSNHISTRVMGTFGYVAPEYAMTGHLLVKSDVYSYGVVLLELLSGKKPVDMSQSPGQENLVTWARPLLTNREGVEQVIDPYLVGNCNFDDVARVAAIASMCVNPEVTLRPFMGEVVQALKLVYNEEDETGIDLYSTKESSARDSDFRCDFVPSDNSWWNVGLNHGQASSFLTMDYSSGPLEERENKPFSDSSFLEGEGFLPIKHGNRSGPLRTIRSKTSSYRLKGSMSEHSGLLPKRAWIDGDRFESSV